MRLDHICFAVKDLKEGLDYWEKVFGYKQLTQIVENTRQKVKVTFLSKEDSINIKLIGL
jgi:catechol 2,3-dioxygenase-like lactoylglutathione lyase family enzyme